MIVRHLLILFSKHVLDEHSYLYIVLKERPALNIEPGKPFNQTGNISLHYLCVTNCKKNSCAHVLVPHVRDSYLKSI